MSVRPKVGEKKLIRKLVVIPEYTIIATIIGKTKEYGLTQQKKSTTSSVRAQTGHQAKCKNSERRDIST